MWDSSVGRASYQNARYNTDAGSVPWYDKELVCGIAQLVEHHTKMLGVTLMQVQFPGMTRNCYVG